jgi:hypothetical protein
VPESYPERNYITSSVEDYRRPDSNDTMARPATPASDFQLAYSTTQQLPPKMRPAVKNVIQALRAMPPEVRERQLNSDRYASFSSAERRLLNTAAHPIAAQ